MLIMSIRFRLFYRSFVLCETTTQQGIQDGDISWIAFAGTAQKCVPWGWFSSRPKNLEPCHFFIHILNSRALLLISMKEEHTSIIYFHERQITVLVTHISTVCETCLGLWGSRDHSKSFHFSCHWFSSVCSWFRAVLKYPYLLLTDSQEIQNFFSVLLHSAAVFFLVIAARARIFSLVLLWYSCCVARDILCLVSIYRRNCDIRISYLSTCCNLEGK